MEDNKNFEFNMLELLKQTVDAQMDKMFLEMVKDNPYLTALFKLLAEYGIRGLRAHEFIMKLGALGGLMNEEGEKDD